MDSTPSPSPTPDTRESLLNAAETLFSEIGIEAASLRAITGAAGANLAAVHYHFGSKQELVRAVFVRRLGPLNQERLRRLEESIAQGGGVEGVVRALVAPLLELFRQQPESARAVVTLIGRAFSDPQGEVKRLLKEQFSEMVERFVAALMQLLPDLSREEVRFRFHLSAGAMAHLASSGHLLERSAGGSCGLADPGVVTEQLVHFLSAGLRAPAAPSLAP